MSRANLTLTRVTVPRRRFRPPLWWWAILVTFGVGIAAIVMSAPSHASPGDCASGGGFGSGGGYCDGPLMQDGTFHHCETVYVLGFGGTNCFWVRPVPASVDPRGWVPA